MTSAIKRGFSALVATVSISSLVCILYDYETLGAGLVMALIAFANFVLVELVNTTHLASTLRRYLQNARLASKLTPHMSLVALISLVGFLYYKVVPSEGQDAVIAIFFLFLIGYSTAAVTYFCYCGSDAHEA